MTSPNIPTPDSATLYTGTILVGNSNLSEGLGTTRPFEFVGAPWIDAEQLQEEMREKDLDGVDFRTQYFTPMFGNFEGELVSGVQVHIEDERKIDVVELGIELVTTMRNQDPEMFEVDDNYNELIGSTLARDMLRDGAEAQDIIAEWQPELETWTKEVRNNYLLYGPYPEGAERYEQQPVLGVLPHDLNLYPGEEVSISLHGFDAEGNELNPDWEEIEWEVPEGIVELENGTVTAINEGEGTLTAKYNGLETSKPIQVSTNVIENVNAEAHDQYTRIVIDLNQTIDFEVEQEDGEVTVIIPQAEFAEDAEAGTVTVDDSPVLEDVNYDIEDGVFTATMNVQGENIEIETPEYSKRVVVDLVHE